MVYLYEDLSTEFSMEREVAREMKHIALRCNYDDEASTIVVHFGQTRKKCAESNCPRMDRKLLALLEMPSLRSVEI